jgi:hypothetical protein
MSLRDTLNNGEPGRVNDVARSLGLGSLLNALIAAMAGTETGVVPASNVATLANQPEFLLDANVTAGTTVGHKKLLKGPITGPAAITPAAGQCVWDGGKKVLFAAADGATAVTFRYTQATDVTVSFLQRDLGEQDTP